MEIRLLNHNDYDEVYSIMKDSFPVDERRRYSEQKELLNKDIYKIYILHGNNDEIIAFIAVYEFETFVFVEHFAVSGEYRGKGLGSEILNYLMNIYSDMICLEVELPVTETAKRRIEFYRKNGFYLNEYEYVQPPISAGRQAVPMKLMTTQRLLQESEFEKVKKKIYSDVYDVSL